MINTKRIFTALLLAIIAVTSYAYDFKVDGIYYNLDSNGDAVVTHGDDKYGGDVIIPEYVTWDQKNRKVVGIGERAFEACLYLTSVYISYYATVIDDFAFYNCERLEEVRLHTKVKKIGLYAFYGCKQLTDFTFPVALEEIGQYALAECSKLSEISLPTNVKTIGDGAFANCSEIRKAYLYGQVESIGAGAFLKCSGMNDLHCYADNPPKLGNNVFLNVNLLNLYVPYGSIKAYKAAATWGDFENIHYNDEVKLNGIWYRLDDYGEGATVINNPDESYSYVYEGDIVIPSQVTVDDTEYEVWDIGNHAFADSKITSITLPNTLIGIGDGAFKRSKITSIDIPNSVYSIGEEAFQYCNQLKSLTLPNSLKIIPGFFLYGCTSLKSIDIPNSVEVINEEAFRYCRVRTIVIPGSVTTIRSCAFYNMDNLKEVYCQAVEVPLTADYVFSGNAETLRKTLYVPEESIEAYKNSVPWCHFYRIKALTTGIEKTETASKPMITTVDGQISVSGLSGNASIQVLSLDGKLLDSSTALDGTATLNALSGEVVIVKVGTESYKVVVK